MIQLISLTGIFTFLPFIKKKQNKTKTTQKTPPKLKQHSQNNNKKEEIKKGLKITELWKYSRYEE